MTRRFVIIGAGAIGGGVGGLLAHRGVPVVLVARGDHLRAMQHSGLTVRTPDDTVTVHPPAVAGPDEVTLTTADVLVVAVKTHQVEAALASWADAPVTDASGVVIGTAGESLPVLMATNGVASEQMALRWFARVFGVCVWMPAVLLDPGEVIVRGGPARAAMHVGRVPQQLTTDADRALLDEVAALWEPAGIVTPRPPDVMAWKYRKLLGNLGNAVQALTGTGDAAVADLVRAEARRVLDAAGVVLNSEQDESAAREVFSVQKVPGEPADMGGSTWQSLARGTGSAETDYLNGEIVAIAHSLGLTAPVNGELARLMRQAVRDGARPGSITVDDLRQRLADVETGPLAG